MYMKSSVFIISFCLIGFFAFSQSSRLSTKSKKAAELYAEADNFRVRGQYSQAINLLEQAIAKDKKFYEAYFRLALIIKAQGKLDQAETLFKKVVELNEGNNAASFFELGDLYLKQSEYNKSIEFANKYLAYNPRNSRRIQEAQAIIKNAEFALNNENKKALFNPRPLSDTVNTFPMQYFPVVSVDGSSLIYTRRMGTTSQYDEDLVISKRDENNRWSTPESISENINSEFNEGTCTISADGRTLIFTSCYGRKGYGSCDLYISVKTGEEWSVPQNLGPSVNSSAWDSQPSLSADGRTLYFISNRNGGIGGRDIWFTKKDDKNTWGKPQNMGPVINTVNEEVSPFIHPNNRTLYYGTNGLPGFGGFDLYYSNIDNDLWTKPKNMGAPINNGEDQVSLFIAASGDKGYYSNEDTNSDKKGILYQFSLTDLHEVEYNVSYVSGIVTDKETSDKLMAEIELVDINSNKRVSLVSSDSITGKYLMVLTEGSEYALYINRKDYLFKSYSFVFDDSGESIEQNIELERIKEGVTTDLRNIFFETDKFDIKSSSYAELDKVVRFIKENPSLKIEISGHTDNVGSAEYNLTLSEKRAQSVAQYLFNKGVDENIINTAGFGSSQPKATNDSEKGRQLNRRIELKIVKF